ncbi:hypothetical protein GO611_23910, partial [Azoarcus communis SWub3 = DSM 12120]
PHPHPQKIRLTLGDDQQPYPVGAYVMADESHYPDRFGQVTTRRRTNTQSRKARSLLQSRPNCRDRHEIDKGKRPDMLRGQYRVA